MLYNDIVMNKVVTVQKYLDKSLSIEDAIKHLQCSERTLYRYVSSYRTEGPSGLIHGLKGRRSNNHKKKREGLERYARQERFRGFGPTLLSEKLEEILGYPIPVESLRRRMIERGVWLPRKPRKIKRYPRKRRPGYGMMIQFDGSYEDWLENGEIRCMLLGVDDATGDGMYVKFTKNEAINDVIEYRKNYFEIHGKPSVIYLDRHASYKVNHRKDQFDQETKTRFFIGMTQLGIQVIYAGSAEGKGRVERRFRLLQDRGIKELRLARINDYDEAEKYMNEVIIPSLNKKFSVKAKIKGDYHVPMKEEERKKLEWYFAKKTKRKINKVGVVTYKGNKYIINRGQSLNGTRDVNVLESHYGNIQIWNGKIKLDYKELTYY